MFFSLNGNQMYYLARKLARKTKNPDKLRVTDFLLDIFERFTEDSTELMLFLELSEKQRKENSRIIKKLQRENHFLGYHEHLAKEQLRIQLEIKENKKWYEE